MVIFTPTVPHTGTWFLIGFLQRLGMSFVEASQLTRGTVGLVGPTVLHAHIPGAVDWPAPAADAPKVLPMGSICLLASLLKTVTPIRDPYAAILTREARHPEYRHFFIVDGFIQAAQRLSGNPNVMFLPIDLPQTPEQRCGRLRAVALHCGLDADSPVIEETAREWAPENCTPNNRFKELYLQKNRERIEFLLGPKVAEIEYLKNQAAIILPFLASLGYTKGDLDLW